MKCLLLYPIMSFKLDQCHHLVYEIITPVEKNMYLKRTDLFVNKINSTINCDHHITSLCKMRVEFLKSIEGATDDKKHAEVHTFYKDNTKELFASLNDSYKFQYAKDVAREHTYLLSWLALPPVIGKFITWLKK